MSNELTDQQSIALAHLSMIAQAANGEYAPRPREIEQRQTWLTEYILTGEGSVSEMARLSAQIVNDALTFNRMTAK